MKTYEFILKFNLADVGDDADKYIALLGKAGCDDALIGIGQKRRIALDFARNGKSAIEAILRAIKEVKSVLPEATLIEATPDLVGITDIADFMGFSRQNMRKLMINNSNYFPPPIHDGKLAIWHLANVLSWFKQRSGKSVEPKLMDIAKATMQINIVKDSHQINLAMQDEIAAVL